MTRLLFLTTSLVWLSACASALEPQLLVPEDVDVDWDSSFNRTEDGLGVLVPVDVMVYEADTGASLHDVRLSIDTDSLDAAVVDHDAVGGAPERWDAMRDRYFSLDAPTSSLDVVTDPDGLARVYVWVDAFESVDPDRFEPVVISVVATVPNIEESFEETFALIPR